MIQEMMGFWDGRSISWTICKLSVTHSSKNLSLNIYRPDALPGAQPTPKPKH